MSVRYFSRKSALAKLIRKPGGVRVGDAIEQATVNLDSIRDACIAEVDANLATIEQVLQDVPNRPPKAALTKAYTCSNEIAGMAGSCGLQALGDAAFSLCELIDRSSASWSPEAVTVHLNAIRLLRRLGDTGGAAQREILEGLRKVATRAAPGPAEGGPS